MATVPPPALALDVPRRRRIVPAAHLRLAETSKPTSTPSAQKKGDVAAFIRSMPNAPAHYVVEAAEAKGIATTVAYVRWRRWADKKGKAARGGAAAKRSPVPKDVPAMFGGAPPRISGDGSDDAEEFRRALGAFVVENGVACVPSLVDELEAKLLAVANRQSSRS